MFFDGFFFSTRLEPGRKRPTLPGKNSAPFGSLTRSGEKPLNINFPAVAVCGYWMDAPLGQRSGNTAIYSHQLELLTHPPGKGRSLLHIFAEIA